MTARRVRPAIELRGIGKTYGVGDTSVVAVRDIDLRVQHGEYIAVMGASGSGKSTLMNLLGCLDTQSSGRYLLDGIDVQTLDDHQLATIRNRKIGFVFQSFNLIPRTRAVDNVGLPLAYARVKAAQRRERAMEALASVGLTDRAEHLPTQLSGGQQQRAAIARAIITRPVLLLADEPTGALDTRASAEIMRLFDSLNAAGRTVVLITHERDVARHARRIIQMRDGQIVSDTEGPGAGGRPE